MENYLLSPAHQFIKQEQITIINLNFKHINCLTVMDREDGRQL